MKPADKFGRPIYEKTFRIMVSIGKKLAKQGYRESARKPNLFYRKTSEGDLFFADMRGTEEVPIWENPAPLFYWRVESASEDWLRTRIVKTEFRRLLAAGCRPRLSFYNWYERGGLLPGDIDEAEDGYCRICGKDFQASGLYCSDVCEEKARKRLERAMRLELERESNSITCYLCGRHPEVLAFDKLESFVKHHTSYSPEKTITVCRSCHAILHDSEDAPRRPKRPWGRRGQLELKF